MFRLNQRLFIRLALAFAFWGLTQMTVHLRDAWSDEGGSNGGGGDTCEARIKVIRDDFKDWIGKGGPAGLTLTPGLTLTQYTQAMLNSISVAKIKCVGEKDAGYPVTVDGTPKICRFDVVDTSDSRITCDIAKFSAISDSDQYVLIHHEYAGISGIETPHGDDSTYVLSNQISEFLVSQVIKKLAVRPNKVVLGEVVRNEDGSVRHMSQLDADSFCKNAGQRLPTARELAIYAQSLGAEGISDTPEDGYTLIKGSDTEGKPDFFYFSNRGYKHPEGDLGKFWYWTSSVTPNHSDWAFAMDGDSGAVGNLWRNYYGVFNSAVRCMREL